MKYSDYCYTGLLDTELNIIYCDNLFLFQRLRMGSVKLSRTLSRARPGNTVYHNFKANNVHYSARLERLLDNFLICRISEEIPEDIANAEYAFADIDNVKNGTLNAVVMAHMIREYMKKSEYCNVNDYLSDPKNQVSNIFSDCVNILELFRGKGRSDFIQLRKWLIHTGDVIDFVYNQLRKRILFIFDIAPPYVKTDYASLELCLYNFGRLAISCTCEGSSSFVEICSCGSEILSVNLRIPLQQNVVLDNFRIEMRAVKHLFSQNLNGHFDFYEQNGFLCGSGCVGAEFSDDLDSLPSRLIPSESFSELIRKRDVGKYRKIYTVHGKNVLESNVKELEDVDVDLDFARMFLLGDM